MLNYVRLVFVFSLASLIASPLSAHAATANVSVEAVICPKHTGNGKDVVTMSGSVQWNTVETNARASRILFHEVTVNRDAGGNPGVHYTVLSSGSTYAPGTFSDRVEYGGLWEFTSLSQHLPWQERKLLLLRSCRSVSSRWHYERRGTRDEGNYKVWSDDPLTLF